MSNVTSKTAPASLHGPPVSAGDPPTTRRAFTCRCGRPIFFPNTLCLGCGRALGYDPEQRRLLPLEELPDDDAIAPAPGTTSGTDDTTGAADAAAAAAATDPALNKPARSTAWREAGAGGDAPRYHLCARRDTASGCNWLVGEGDSHAGDPPQCRCCRLLRNLPDLDDGENARLFAAFELARRRLVSSLIALGLPVRSRLFDDPDNGLAFDILRAAPGEPPVTTGHDDGVVTLDLLEADDAQREHRRQTLAEPYRTLLGHLRHETGHYYWQLLVRDAADRSWLERFRGAFGDERADYAAALKAHYENGPPADWPQRHVSAYASSHPWEDWAETWAQYLHLVDTLDTARSFGLGGEHVDLEYEPFGADALPDDAGADGEAFLELLRHWMELTGVLNELSRSMGVADFYPFVLSKAAVGKLYFVHRVVVHAAETADGPAAPEAAGSSR